MKKEGKEYETDEEGRNNEHPTPCRAPARPPLATTPLRPPQTPLNHPLTFRKHGPRDPANHALPLQLGPFPGASCPPNPPIRPQPLPSS
ncbi:hypothetical protein Tco_0999175, partial [Tanacetum coccineum]